MAHAWAPESGTFRGGVIALPLIVTAAAFILGGQLNRAANRPVARELDEMPAYVSADETLQPIERDRVGVPS